MHGEKTTCTAEYGFNDIVVATGGTVEGFERYLRVLMACGLC